jgi:hypothetical protein
MLEQTQWEYRVQTIGSMWGTKDEQIQAMLNEWRRGLGSDQCLYAVRQWQSDHRCQTSVDGRGASPAIDAGDDEVKLC